jgi:hypothetical protein
MTYMQKRIYLAVALIIVGWLGYRGYRIATSTTHSPTDSIQVSQQGLDVMVRYGRPYKKGRVIFGEAKDRAWLPDGPGWTLGFRLLTGQAPTTGALVPNDTYWRLGANYATEISFNKDVVFGDQPVTAGRYRMYAIPHTDTWDVVLNSEVGQWGYYEPNYTLDVIKTKVPVLTSPSETEQFTILLRPDSSEVKMNLMWDKTVVSVPIRME